MVSKPVRRSKSETLSLLTDRELLGARAAQLETPTLGARLWPAGRRRRSSKIQGARKLKQVRESKLIQVWIPGC